MVLSIFLLLLCRRLAFSRVILLLLLFFFKSKEEVAKLFPRDTLSNALSIAFIETAQITLDVQGLPEFCPDHNTCFKGFFRREE